MNPVRLSIFANRLSGVCDEMGAVLRLSALSPNIKDRLDFSCAIFDAQGRLCAQAAHIPVHLGSMAYAMADLVSDRDWQPGDLLVVNDPYMGGTHLPDVTVVAPVFGAASLIGFAVTRAHHANIGAHSPGSMPVSTRLDQEGIVIAPSWLKRVGQWQVPLCRELAGLEESGALPVESRRFADFVAQASACEAGARRLAELADQQADLVAAFDALNRYGEKRARARIAALPDGCYRFQDYMDDDGQGQQDIVIAVTLTIAGELARLDFSGTADQVAGNINCPLSVAAAAAYYCFRCLMDDDVPACDGLFRPISLSAPQGSLLNANRPAAVAAGNVETSSRVVDVVLGALAQAAPEAIPAASQGTMNNVAMGAAGENGWDYYETMAGGTGAHARGPGLSAVHSHMTNTLNTPIESLESHYPLRVHRYQVRRGSGGDGQFVGGDGLVRELEFLGDAQVTLLTERRRHAPWGLAGGQLGAVGENRHNGELLPPKTSFTARAGDRLLVASPGGGGYCDTKCK
ncbi:MAG: 5-oxoprolinase [Alcanivorax sp.]|uniref:hydantoinase B/oxoprolinase family protein n=1 Tax=unclassified Alcanivorax TaxID=2638842 RepID=UPI000C97012F|nr:MULTISPECIES: hydantoinase B/oxoprolinase family protein [unclassified Alcanivorax]MAC13582.1 5-oxoprolinase [Alcanivorax sp.]|tara:strand:+ start:811 stop:2361 length:1551 start_codon:yes stop_codon:yes gene_type:complete